MKKYIFEITTSIIRMKKIIAILSMFLISFAGLFYFFKYAKADLNDGLQASYSFTSNSNDSVNGNNLTVEGSLSYPDGVNFTGSQLAYINDSNQTGLDVGGNFTIAFQSKLNSLPGDGQYSYYQFINKSNESSNQRGIELYYRNYSQGDATGQGKEIRMAVSADGIDNCIYHVPANLSTSSTDNIVVKWASGVMYVYQNESLLGSSSGITGGGDPCNISSVYNNNAPFVVGAYYDNSNNWKSHYLDGKIKNLKVWSRALTSGEISSVFGTTPTPSPTPSPDPTATPTPTPSSPADPSENDYVIWTDTVTGDVKIKVTHGGVTKTTTLVDFSTL